jgi:hypothetical protein
LAHARGVARGFFQQEGGAMSEAETVVTPQAAPDDPASSATPTVTHHQQIAAKLNAAIDEMLALIPDFVESHPATAVFVRTHQNVPVDFIATAIASAEANPEVLAASGFDVTKARDTLQFGDAFRPMADKFDTAAKNIRFTIDFKRAEVNNEALQFYAVAKGSARDPRKPAVSAHVGNLKRDLGRTGNVRKKKVTPAPAPAPTTPAPTGGGSSTPSAPTSTPTR